MSTRLWVQARVRRWDFWRREIGVGGFGGAADVEGGGGEGGDGVGGATATGSSLQRGGGGSGMADLAGVDTEESRSLSLSLPPLWW